MNILLCRLLALCVLWCLSLSSGQAQIVSNPYFHSLNPASPLTICTTANVTAATLTNLLQDMCYAWGTPTNGTPDFYYGCDNLPTLASDYGVPVNIHFDGPLEDPMYPTTTNTRDMLAYAGIELIDNTSATYRDREYITQELNEPLQPGVYKISFMVHASNQAGNYLIKQLGCLFTDVRPNPANTTDFNNGTMYTGIGNYIAFNHPTGFPSDQWYTTTAQIVITGVTKKFLTIGNFQEDIADVDWVAQYPEDDPVETDQGYAYYFIDNVYICEPCAVEVDVTKATSEDPSKCCYNISISSEARSCSVFSGFRIRSATSGDTLYSENTEYGWASEDFSVCLDRFESQVVLIELLGADGQVVCAKSRELICDCRCEDLINPQGVSITATRLAVNSCCWNVELKNNSNIYNDGCNLLGEGIAVTIASPAYIVPHPGYEIVTIGTVTYLKKSTTASTVYEAGTSTLLATICVSRGTVNAPVHFDILKGFSPGGEPIYCGTGYNLALTCTDACCDFVLGATQRSVASGNPLECCFAIDVQLYYKFYHCIQILTIQRFNGTSWVDESTMVITTASLSIPQCIPVGTSKQVRLVFKNPNGEAVCIKTFTLSCDCCSAVSNLQATRITQNPCCFRINGYAYSTPACPISNYIIEQYQPGTGMWNLVVGGIPATNGYFESTVCIYSTSATIRIRFRGANNNVICTRELQLVCNSGGPIGKMGTENMNGNLQPEVYAVPNPAIGETTIHYTLRETSDVRLSLYNMLGEMMIEIQSAQVSAGAQATTIQTNDLPSGMYFMQVHAGGSIVTIPITIVK